MPRHRETLQPMPDKMHQLNWQVLLRRVQVKPELMPRCKSQKFQKKKKEKMPDHREKEIHPPEMRKPVIP